MIVLRLVGIIVLLFLVYLALASCISLGIYSGLIAYFGDRKNKKDNKNEK